MLEANDLLIGIPHRSRGPVVDGVLDDPTWEGAAHVNRFQKTLKIMRAVADDGNSHAYFVYTDSSLFLGMVRYDVDVSKLHYKAAVRDDYDIWKDDHFYVRIKTGIDENLAHAIVVNPAGTVLDSNRGDPSSLGIRWNGEINAAAHIGEDYWSMEFEVPFRSLKSAGTKRGDAWVLNPAWGNISMSTHAEWVGNHGISSLVGGLAIFD